MLSTLDPNPVPGITALRKELNSVLIELKAKITVHLEVLTKLVFAVIW